MTRSRHGFICCIVFLWSMAVAGGAEPVNRFDNVVKRLVQAGLQYGGGREGRGTEGGIAVK